MNVVARVVEGSVWQAEDMGTGWAAWALVVTDVSFYRLKVRDRMLWSVLAAARPNGRVRFVGEPDPDNPLITRVTELEVL